jgi:hypothetical protein
VLRREPLVLAFAAEPPPAGVVLRPVAGAPEWELRAARAAGGVAAIHVQAAIEALRAAAGNAGPEAQVPLRVFAQRAKPAAG